MLVEVGDLQPGSQRHRAVGRLQLTQSQAQQVFVFWKEEIEDKDLIWRYGWNIELARLKVKFRAENIGALFFGRGD